MKPYIEIAGKTKADAMNGCLFTWFFCIILLQFDADNCKMRQNN